jgi:cytochrome c-type biogenesis protein CcmH
MIKEQIARAVQELGIEVSSLKPSADIQALIKTKAMPQGALQQTAPSPAKTQMHGPTTSDVEAAGQMSAEDRAAFIRSMVQRLADRLKENPNDRNGWLRLARAYDVLGEKEKAREARAKAKSLSQK